jgi:hypothetical protein
VAAAVVVQRYGLDAAAREVTVVGAVAERVQRGNAQKREQMGKNAERDDPLIGPQPAEDAVFPVR